jgi:hypothetical protein
MPRLIARNPAYRLHKPSGQAVVTLSGQDIYLGSHGSSESRRAYDHAIAEWLARGRQLPGVDDNRRTADVIKGYWDYAKVYYGTEEGIGELRSIKAMLAVLRRAYGPLPAREFGPLALQVVRERMIKAGWSRRYINAQIGRLKRAFKWACSRELIPPSVYHGLQAVDGLRQGKTEARECEPVKPVPEEWVGNCYDNAAMESFWGTLKTEHVYRRELRSRAEAKSSILLWIEGWYNRRRRHSALGYKSPEQFEASLN